MTTRNETLNVLSILHYVLGGITALFACIPFIHLFIGIALVMGMLEAEEGMAWVGWLFIVFPSVFILLGWVMAVLIITAGRRLGAQRGRTFCQIIAGLECLLFPFGTALGITTLVLLSQPEQAGAFHDTSSPTPPGAPPPL